MDICFILCVINHYDFYFVAQIVPTLILGSYSSHCDTLPPMCVHLCVCLEHFLVLQDASDSSCIFPAPILESAISFKE